MKKLLAFGCSFTDYGWSTWADILGREFDDFENHGKSGAGNTYIFNHVMQCIAENRINESSTVIVMWSNVIREDRYVNGEWIAPGCIYNQATYKEGFMDFVDPVGMFIRDCANVAAVAHALDSTGCTYHFLSMMPMDNAKEYLKLKWTEKIFASDIVSQYKRKYKKYLDLIKPSMLEVVFNNNWYNRLDDLAKVAKDKTWYNNLYIPDNWFPDQQPEDSVLPGLDNLHNCNDRVKSFLCEKMNAQSIDEIIEFKLWQRPDLHPTPLLHLEYLQKVLPEYTISEENIQKVKNENSGLSI